MNLKRQVTVIGDGRWGCTIATLAARNGHHVTIYGLPDTAETLKTSRRIPGSKVRFQLPKSIEVKSHEKPVNLGFNCLLTDVVFLAVPGRNLKDAWSYWKQYILQGLYTPVVVVATKALESYRGFVATPLDLIDTQKKCFLASAAFPEGVLRGYPTVGTVYSETPYQIVAELFKKSPIRFYASGDLVGGQIVSAMKNPIAIAAGAAQAMGFDAMTVNALVGRGVNEIWKFARKLGASDDILGPNTTVLSDLFGTCNSPYSHHVQAGHELVSGTNPADLEQKIGTVEGIHTLEILREFAPHDYDENLPIHNVVGKMLFNNLSPKLALRELMARP